MHLRIGTFKLTFPGNRQNSDSVAQHSSPDEKNTDFHQFYLHSFSISCLPVLVAASPLLWHIMGQLFPLSRTWGFHTYFSQEVQSEHFVCALSVSPVLAAAKQQLTGEEVFSSTLKAAALWSSNKATNQTALQLFSPQTGCFTKTRSENLPQNRVAKTHCPPTQTQLSLYLYWHTVFTSPLLPVNLYCPSY